MTEAEFYSLLDNIQSGECEISATELYEELDALMTIEARRRDLVERYAASTSPLIFNTISLWLRRHGHGRCAGFEETGFDVQRNVCFKGTSIVWVAGGCDGANCGVASVSSRSIRRNG